MIFLTLPVLYDFACPCCTVPQISGHWYSVYHPRDSPDFNGGVFEIKVLSDESLKILSAGSV